jgi:hypothetical protein
MIGDLDGHHARKDASSLELGLDPLELGARSSQRDGAGGVVGGNGHVTAIDQEFACFRWRNRSGEHRSLACHRLLKPASVVRDERCLLERQTARGPGGSHFSDAVPE